MDDVTVVGVADPVIERAQSLTSEVGGSPFDDHRRMLDEAKPEVVWVCSPCWLHADQTVDCAESGAHVMCEKPMSLNLLDCDRMIASAVENGVKLMIGQSTRFSPTHLELKRIKESGECGDLVRAWSIRESYHHVRNDAMWRLDGDKSGGIVFEWEVHEIDFLRSIGGEVSEVYARTAYSRHDAPTFLDTFSAIFTFEDGGYGNIEASQSATIRMTSRGFSGTSGTAVAKGRNEVSVGTVAMDKPESRTVEPDDGAARGLGRHTPNRAFLDAILNDQPSPVPGEDAKKNIEIGLAIIESGESGKVVSIS